MKPAAVQPQNRNQGARELYRYAGWLPVSLVSKTLKGVRRFNVREALEWGTALMAFVVDNSVVMGWLLPISTAPTA